MRDIHKYKVYYLDHGMWPSAKRSISIKAHTAADAITQADLELKFQFRERKSTTSYELMKCVPEETEGDAK